MGQTLHPVWLDDQYTTATLPHRKFTSGGNTYYVATYPEGDLAIHESYRNHKEGYGRSMVSFLMEDGSVEDVLGPFECQGLFDNGRRERMAKQLGPAARKQATRIVLGYNLAAYGALRDGPRRELFAEDGLSCEPLTPRLCEAVEAVRVQGRVPAKLEAAIYTRGGSRLLRRSQIIEALNAKNKEPER